MIYYIFLLLFLLLGLLNPVAGNKVDVFVGFFLFCFVATVAVFPEKAKRFREYSIFVLILCFLLSSFATSHNLRAKLRSDVALYTYNNDESAFLKTYKLMKSDIGYYDAYKVAFMGKFTGPVTPNDVWGWRLPTIFEIWRITPGNGIGIYIFYLLLASLALYGAYSVGNHYLGSRYALLPAYLLFPYLHFAARDEILLLTEWWGALFFMIGLSLFILRHYFFSIISLALAVLVRELYFLPLFFIFLYFTLRFNRKAWVFLIPIVAFFAFFLYHIISLTHYIDAWNLIFSTRSLGGGTLFIQQTLAFGSWEYKFFILRPFIIFLISVLGSCFYIYKINAEEGWVWLVSALVFPIIFLKFSVGPYHDYWGILYMPIVLILAPICLGNLQGREKQA